MITRPLDLTSRLSRPPRDLDFFAWVNVGVIVLFFGLLGSRFVLAPGTRIGVTETNLIELPQAAASAEGTGTASVVVSYQRDNVILFEGGMYTLPALRKQMEAYATQHPGAVMLIRCDRQVSVQALFDLWDMARKAGFAGVLMAAESPISAESPAGQPTEGR